jgi:lysyl-tRNA synthetase class 2
MLDDIIRERRKKLELLREKGIDPYPARVPRTGDVLDALDAFDAWSAAHKEISLAGRVRSLRDQGKIIFLDLEDETGKLQAVLKEDVLVDLPFWRSVIDIGDFLSVTGTLFVTKRGEKSIEAHAVQFGGKTLKPLPDKWDGVQDVELRLRERYVDLLAHPDVREMFVRKSLFWASVREFLENEGFLEVETSVLEPEAGGAEAEPFKTRHNALDTDFYLRIALELQLKKLVVGGFDKVFEIGRVFRNEGIDREHLQDFTFMECYWAYHDYRDLMKLLQKMFRFVIEHTMGTLSTHYHGYEIDWSGEWPEVDYVSEFTKENGLNPLEATRDALFEKAKSLGLALEANLQKGRLIDLIYKKTVRPKLIQPCFLVGTPVVVSPLAKASRENPAIAERFQIVACGTELGNGFSELNDPDEQRRRFEEQMALRAKGDKEAMALDEDFLNALSYGLPPTAGFGMSERVFAILVDRPVRETVFFPLMKRKDERSGEAKPSVKKKAAAARPRKKPTS